MTFNPIQGDIDSEILGLVGFQIVAVTPTGDPNSRELPRVDVRVLDANQVCGQALELFDDAPTIISESEPFDVDCDIYDALPLLGRVTPGVSAAGIAAGLLIVLQGLRRRD